MHKWQQRNKRYLYALKEEENSLLNFIKDYMV